MCCQTTIYPELIRNLPDNSPINGDSVELEEQPALSVSETALLSEPALAEDWNRPEEDEAWSHLQNGNSPGPCTAELTPAMKTTDHIKDFINAFTSWASTQPDILAVALVGSYAREAATEDSDVDLIVLANDPKRYVENADWLKRFGPIERQQTEDYGKVTSLRVWYVGGHEVEYGLTTSDWAQLPLDEGTQRVIEDGMKVLFERKALLSPHL